MTHQHNAPDLGLKGLITEARNPSSAEIDRLTPLEIVQLMNREDARVADAVGAQAESIATAIEATAERMREGGRIIYVGAGTSGRLGVLDAAECPPTFNSPPEQVVGVIAGGREALVRAVEGAEDHPELGAQDLQPLQIGPLDTVVGIATSGRTPYVLGALQFAKTRGATTIGLSCNADSALEKAADLMIVPIVGPEIISGSTRLKAGTATKMVLNMLTTGVMVLLGKTYGNLMVDLRATNQKLTDRTRRIVCALTGLGDAEALELLQRADGELKTAVVMHKFGGDAEQARRRLAEGRGQLRAVLDSFSSGDLQHSPGPTLVLGVDGGGSKTTCILATGDSRTLSVLGRGVAGPSNSAAQGILSALANIRRAIDLAFRDAGLARHRVSRACIALAGSQDAATRESLMRALDRARIAEQVLLTHDAEPALQAATENGCGVVLIVGTGSLCWGRNREGTEVRSGGLGPLLDDEGSGYQLGLAALRAVIRAKDGRGAATRISTELPSPFHSQDARTLAKYAARQDRAEIAALAPCLLHTAQQDDEVALQIVRQATRELSAMVIRVCRELNGDPATLPLVYAGGLVAGDPWYRDRVTETLNESGFQFQDVRVVSEPALGAARLALTIGH